MLVSAVSALALVLSGAAGVLVGSGVSGAATPLVFGFTAGTQTYVVPSDGSVCSLQIAAAGANGGSSAFGAGAVGGHVEASFAVSPGDTVSLVVGGVGGDASGTAAGSAGGFGGGGTGGASSGVGHGAAGGGGATTVQINSAVVLVAGGGGGIGLSAVGGAGGAGGSGGLAGSDGSTPPPGTTPEGSGGGGGTTATGGAGGASGGGTTVAGTSGASGVGGAGGNAAANSGGGGGGGGGFFGGGGGGGADLAGGGGGGGGGAGFAAPTATGVVAGTLAQDGAGNGQAVITPGACPVLTVQKVVQGTVPAGTVFTIHVQCGQTVNQDLFFDATGSPTNATNPTVIAPQGGTCNVTETSAGAALSASYACSDNHTTGSAFCQANNQDVIYVTGPGQAATVTVTNTFAAASPIVIVPSFAG